MNRTLRTGLDVLECLAGRAEPMTVGAIARAVGAPAPTVCRMLETLRERGYVEQARNRGDYRAGLRVLELSAGILSRMELRRQAGPGMHALAEATGCSAYLAADVNGRAVMIMTTHPGGRVQAALGEIGHVSACNYTAMGKLIAAFRGADEIAALLKAAPLEKRTPATITSRPRLMRELRAIRAGGLARSRYENAPDVHGLAVPVRNCEGAVIAALGLAVPRRLEAKHGIDRYEAHLHRAGDQLSFALGYAAGNLV